MILLSIFSGALFVLPVAVTGGLYVGLQHQKVIDAVHGKPPPNSNPDGTPRVVETTQYCQKAYGIDPYPFRYTYNPNQWGDPGNTGALCLNITTDTGVPADDLNSFNWTTTWGYPQGPETEPVHAFPNAKLNDTAFPIQVQNLQSLTLDVQWNYAVGNDPSDTTDLDALTAANLNCNVAVDMFLSEDETKAENSTLASYEVMVWLGRFGPSTQPLGFTTTPALQQQAGGLTFSLYFGANDQGQEVFTWLAPQNTTSFTGDISPLITALSTNPKGPSSQAYLGYYAFGTEAFYSGGNVTLSVPKLALEVNGN